MKAASLTDIRKELKHLDEDQLREIVLRLGRFKKDNKELLTYLLFHAGYEGGYIELVKEEVAEQFAEMNKDSWYYMKKSVRKILRELKKRIRYSGQKQTEVELLIAFVRHLTELLGTKRVHSYNAQMHALKERQIGMIRKAIAKLHEDLQYDYELELAELE